MVLPRLRALFFRPFLFPPADHRDGISPLASLDFPYRGFFFFGMFLYVCSLRRTPNLLNLASHESNALFQPAFYPHLPDSATCSCLYTPRFPFFLVSIFKGPPQLQSLLFNAVGGFYSPPEALPLLLSIPFFVLSSPIGYPFLRRSLSLPPLRGLIALPLID